jgi:diketogulonate reductase-like aldo/keto reductase
VTGAGVRTGLNRRGTLLGSLGGLAVGLASGAGQGQAQDAPLPAERTIPSSGETLPAVGLGSWITFNVGDDPVLRDECAEVIRAFFASGGRMIDSSPMYGSSQAVIGHGLARTNTAGPVFSADKVWISSGAAGPEQIAQSQRNWGVPRFDLVQVHNLLSWQDHLATLAAMKEEGRLHYVGITTSEGRRHAEFVQVMRTQPLDFIQVTYNVLDREVEEEILPLAQDRGIAVIVNRPFRQRALIRQVEDHPLPAWAAEIDCASWAQFLLKFIISHPAVTCVIPATTRVDHVMENMGAAQGRMPDAAMRRRMADHVESL